MGTVTLMSCKEERQLGIKLAQAAKAARTQAAFEDDSRSPKDIVNAAAADCEECGGLDVIISGVLQGPPGWSYAALRHLPDVGARRDELLARAALDPKSAFHTLRNIPDLGSHREALLQKATEDPGWAHMTLRHVPNLAGDAEALRVATASAPPVEVGWGYNTYFVNQSGIAIWVMYNTGERGSGGSITGPVEILKGQNIGYGRGGACISEMRAFKSKPASWSSGGAGDVGWDPTPIDGCLSWGFRITMDPPGRLNVAEAYPWAEGQPGMPGQYPPSSGS